MHAVLPSTNLRRGIVPILSLLVGLAALLFVTGRPLASERDSDPDAIGSGTLMLQPKGVATAIPAVRLGTDMEVTISGQIARIRVTQAFRNMGNDWVEATYLYPLPEEGAVDSLNMVVGQRVIVGRIKRREEARAIYEQAKQEGKKAGLVESERPNLFRNSVANVGPGETVLVAIEYQAPVRQIGGEYSLRLPLVVGPRYVPPHTVTDGAALDDARNVTAPLAHPDLGKALNPVSIKVSLAPGFVPAEPASPYHRIVVEQDGPQTRTIRLADGEVPADRDFELNWRPESTQPTLGLFRQNVDGQAYVMAAITPPAAAPATPLPRELVFVIDNSGSMGGASMAAAKDSLLYALGTLRPQDRFNIIRFDHTMTQLFDRSVLAEADQIALARRFTEGLAAGGGTEMLPALDAALVDGAPDDASTVRQIVFLTDGDLSNEREMMAAIAARGGRSRIFMVGIGSAPNNFLMRRMSEAGRGTYTNVGSGEEVKAKMTAFLDRLKAPVVRDLKVSVDGTSLDLTPTRLPDLYAGEPLVLLGRGKEISGSLTVSGTIGDKAWSQRVELADAADSPAIAKLWANRRIAEIEARRSANEMKTGDADSAIADLGLNYSIVTRLTSLVAVDETPSRPANAALRQDELPLLLPAGWDFAALFGGQPIHADRSDAATPPAGQSESMRLPKTATGYLTIMMQGLCLLLIGLAGWFWQRRQVAA
ncbi:marine proteobacterial sortase target protein [Terrihabitans sp. B22-R8]|uniref:marine proteobacterial sortase target protein n=1 Tax=Terrihabitans sp. B22-R8 TaxID=3425128 RepID=UPI00403C3CA7